MKARDQQRETTKKQNILHFNHNKLEIKQMPLNNSDYVCSKTEE